MNYEFIGKPDKIFPHLITGAVYSLTIKEERIPFLENPIKWFWGITRPIVTHPIGCPYDSWKAFYNNWKKL